MGYDEAIKGGQAAQARAQRDIGGVWLIVIEEARGSWGSYIYQGDIRIYPMDNGRRFCATCPAFPHTECNQTFGTPQEAYEAQMNSLWSWGHKLERTLRNQEILAPAGELEGGGKRNGAR